MSCSDHFIPLVPLEEVKIVPGYLEYRLLAHYELPTDPLTTTGNVIVPMYKKLLTVEVK